MTRLQRALIIRNKVLSLAETQGSYRYENSGRALVISEEQWFARYHCPFNPALGTWWPRSDLSDGPLPARLYPYGLSLWLRHGPKVLKLVWLDEQNVKLISMRRGDWEAEFFGLPAYKGTAALQAWELYARRAKRW